MGSLKVDVAKTDGLDAFSGKIQQHHPAVVLLNVAGAKRVHRLLGRPVDGPHDGDEVGDGVTDGDEAASYDVATHEAHQIEDDDEAHDADSGDVPAGDAVDELDEGRVYQVEDELDDEVGGAEGQQDEEAGDYLSTKVASNEPQKFCRTGHCLHLTLIAIPSIILLCGAYV